MAFKIHVNLYNNMLCVFVCSFLDHLVPLVKPPPTEPHCTDFPLDFSMLAMEHLEGVQGRRGLVAPPEKSVLSEVEMRLEMLGSLVHHALNKVNGCGLIKLHQHAQVEELWVWLTMSDTSGASRWSKHLFR